MKSGIWARTGESVMSKQLYSFMVSFWTLVGVVVSFLVATQTTGWNITGWSGLFIGVVVLVTCLSASSVALRSDKPLVSFAGYMVVAVALGALMGPVLSAYSSSTIIRVGLLTTGLVVMLGFLGALIPEDLRAFGSVFVGLLWTLIAGMLIVPLAGLFGLDVQGAWGWLDVIGIVIFCGLVVYDWNRAMRIPYTMDNAIDCGMSIYLDWFNIFLRMLGTRGKN